MVLIYYYAGSSNHLIVPSDTSPEEINSSRLLKINPVPKISRKILCLLDRASSY